MQQQQQQNHSLAGTATVENEAVHRSLLAARIANDQNKHNSNGKRAGKDAPPVNIGWDSHEAVVSCYILSRLINFSFLFEFLLSCLCLDHIWFWGAVLDLKWNRSWKKFTKSLREGLCVDLFKNKTIYNQNEVYVNESKLPWVWSLMADVTLHVFVFCSEPVLFVWHIRYWYHCTLHIWQTQIIRQHKNRIKHPTP